MKLYKRFFIWMDVIFCFFATFFGVKANIKSPEETVEEINKGRSLIRFGDGEFGIFRNKSIHYQDWSPELRERFEMIKRDFEEQGDNCPYLLTVQKCFICVNSLRLLKKRVYVSCWSQTRYDFKKNFNHDLTYGETLLFEKGKSHVYGKIWTHESCPPNIIFVHNDEKYAKFFEQTYHKNTFFVKCPPKHAFSKLDEMEKEIQAIIDENGWEKDQVMIVMSAGPAGKVIIYDFSKQGYHCVDTGHCWDDPLEGI